MRKAIGIGAVFMMALGCGCSPAAPDLSQSLTASNGYTVSGVVTNDGGAPLAGARVTLDHGDNLPDLNPTTRRVVTSTGPDGRYSLFLRPDQVRSGYSPFAIIRAETFNTGITGIRAHAQLLDGQGTSSVKNFRLRPYRPVALGESIEVTIDSETPLCDIDGLSVTTICDVVHGIHHTNAREGTLIIEARPLAATVVPTVRTWGRRAGQGTLSLTYPFEVDIDDIAYPFSIAVEVPLGTPPQRYELVTRVVS